jgi:hypothetical protein
VSLPERAPAVPKPTGWDYMLPFLYRRKLKRHRAEMDAWQQRCIEREVRAFDAALAHLDFLRDSRRP